MENVPRNRIIGAGHRYQRHLPENTPLYPIVEQHLPSLRYELQRREVPLPRFVLSEFQGYLRCGRLEYGFVRVKCNGCRYEHLVAGSSRYELLSCLQSKQQFSCKRRGFCPSCGARRMIEASAHLVDHVFPEVSVRQWVFSFPWPLRLLFASQPDALGRCLSVIIRAIQTNLAHRAGLTASSGARTGVVTLIQRFGSALNLKVHLHMLILDGVYTLEQNGPRFHRVGAPDPRSLERLRNRLIRRIVCRLTRDGLLVEDPEQPWLDLEPTDALDHLNAASIRYRIAVGQGAGGRTLTLKNPALVRTDSTPKPFTANRDGFSLNCAVSCQAHQRDRLERLCRYITRPALCLERLSTNAAGQVIYQLKNPFRDGTTHMLFSPEDFIARLAALVPRPRVNLIRYHGVFAPSSPMRRAIVPTPAGVRQRRRSKDSASALATRQHPEEPPSDRTDPPTAPLTWAQRLKRVFEIDITICPLCGGQLRIYSRLIAEQSAKQFAARIADIIDLDLIRKILDHVNSRAPPRLPPRRTESPDPTRSVRQTLKIPRQQPRLRTRLQSPPFLPKICRPTIPTVVRHQAALHRPVEPRQNRPTLTPAPVLKAFEERPRYPSYPLWAERGYGRDRGSCR